MDVLRPHAIAHLDDRRSSTRLRLRDDCGQSSEDDSLEPAADRQLRADPARLPDARVISREMGRMGGASARIVAARGSHHLATMTAEEGYIASPIALAVTMLLFPRSWMPRARNGRAILAGLFCGILIAGIYLSKSSMIAVAVVMLLALLIVSSDLRLTAFAAIPLALAILGWGAWASADNGQARGRFAVGTSLDGYNLHKGNNPTFLEHYPPPPNMNIDPFYAILASGISTHRSGTSMRDKGRRLPRT